jgi:N-acetylmuramic acid 6-phosphate etherase
MPDYNELIKHLDSLDTEKVNAATADIDRLDSLQIATRINQEDQSVAFVVQRALPQIAQVAERFAATLKAGGRVFYIGAGTSGRLGVLDAAECPPTFGTDPGRIIGVIAGGEEALVLSAEGAEDNRQAAINALKEHALSDQDLVIGLAASIRTPYTLAGLEYAVQVGAATAFIICNEIPELDIDIDHIISLPVGPEAIAGSTRMKSGTAQKMTLNLISTTAMVLVGKTWGNLMVDLQARSDKLAARSRKTLRDVCGVDVEAADKLLAAADGSVKVAIVMHKLDCDANRARECLREADGFIWRCLKRPGR